MGSYSLCFSISLNISMHLPNSEQGGFPSEVTDTGKPKSRPRLSNFHARNPLSLLAPLIISVYISRYSFSIYDSART